jgi:hypothetical protein
MSVPLPSEFIVAIRLKMNTADGCPSDRHLMDVIIAPHGAAAQSPGSHFFANARAESLPADCVKMRLHAWTDTLVDELVRAVRGRATAVSNELTVLLEKLPNPDAPVKLARMDQVDRVPGSSE